MIVSERLYISCVRSSMLHGSWTWPIRKENEVTFQRVEMRIVRWISGLSYKIEFQVKSCERETRIRLRWYGHVLRKEDNDWVKKCMEYEVESARPIARPKKSWREIVIKDCQACKLNREDVMDHNRWRKHIRDD